MVSSAHGTTVKSILQMEKLRLWVVSWYIHGQIMLP